jgi:osmotically-inducible protein OsmY
MNSTIFKTDADIKKDILSELEYEPKVKATDIGVLVKEGTVTLNGFASSYVEKSNAVSAAKRVAGVNAIANNIEVQLPSSIHRNDSDIALSAANELKWAWTVPKDTINTTVSNGWITLDGELEWWHQKNSAELAVQKVEGIKGVINMITVKPKAVASEIQGAITSAFKRNALLDASKINVQAVGTKVTLTGKVRNHTEREEAERAAWSALGVGSVDNQLVVNWAWLG